MKAKIWNHRKWIGETNPETIKKKYEERLKNSGFHILGFVDYYFQPFGYTCLFLLGESHFAVHTFPEESKSYIELSSCNEEYFRKFVEQEQ